MPRTISKIAQLLATVAALCLVAVSGALAQTFPTKPIRIVVPFPAGGPSDFAARVISQPLIELLGRPVIIDNRVGASGAIGVDSVVRSPPDGYTLTVATVGIMSIAPHLGKVPYDPLRDLVPITNLMGGPLWLLTHQSVPVHNIKQLIALARARPGQLNYATSGLGQAAHLTGELLKNMAGNIDIVAVHYKGAAPAFTAVLAGEMSMYLSSSPLEVMPFVKAGRIRMLAVTSPKRAPATPDVPTVDESGLKGFDVLTWNGLLAPAGTPREIIAHLNRDVVKALHAPKVVERVDAQGIHVIGDTPEAFGARIRGDSDRWGRLIKQLGIKLE